MTLRLRGRLIGKIPYYKHTTAFGVEKQKSFNRTLVNQDLWLLNVYISTGRGLSSNPIYPYPI